MQNNLTDADFQKLRGGFIPPELATAAGLFRVNDIDGADLIGRTPNAKQRFDGIVFPYFNPLDKNLREYCLRRDFPELEQGKDGQPKIKQKYLHSRGARNMFYFPPNITAEHLQNEQLPAVITEGEKKTLALHHLATAESDGLRFAAIGLSGVWNFRGTVGKTANEYGARQDVKGIIPDFQLVKWENRKVFIVFDANVKTNESVKSARKALVETLAGLGAKPIPVDLPDGYELNGVDDLLAHWERQDGLEKAIEKGLDLLRTAKPFKLGLTFGELQNIELKPRVEKIRGLAAGENGIMNAVTNVGKSTMIRNLAVSLTAKRIFAPFTTSLDRPLRVVIIDAEDTPIYLRSDISRMIASFTPHEKQLVSENLMLMCDVSIGDDELQINNPKHFKMLASAISDFKADVVFVDTISRSFAIKNENDNAEMKEGVLKKLKRLAVVTETAVLGTHHIGKAKLEEGQTKDGAHRGRGASSFADQSRVIFNLEKNANDEVILSCPKIKGERVDDAVFKLDTSSRWFLKQTESSAKTNYQILLESLRPETEYKTAEIVALCQSKMSESTTKRVIEETVKKGDLLPVKRGVYKSLCQSVTPIRVDTMTQRNKANDSNDLQAHSENSKNERDTNFSESAEVEIDL